MSICFTFLLALCVPACAQTLEMTPATVDQGSSNIFRIVLTARTAKPLTALQWELVYGEGLLIEATGIVSGTASETAGKSVTCAARPPEGANHRLICILAGGIKTIPTGPIAIVRFAAAINAPKGDKTVSLEKGRGVTASLEAVPLEGTKTAVTVR